MTGTDLVNYVCIDVTLTLHGTLLILRYTLAGRRPWLAALPGINHLGERRTTGRLDTAPYEEKTVDSRF